MSTLYYDSLQQLRYEVLSAEYDLYKYEKHKQQDKKQNELKQELLRIIAHELKTPMSVLQLVSDLHFARHNSQKDKKDGEVVKREIKKLTFLINDILDDTLI